jgi:hypothetical protein
MKIALRSLLLLLISLALLQANAPAREQKKLPLTQSLPLLKTIEKYALHIGSGPTQVYLFVDPLCPMSQEFISLISQSKRMQKLYSYHIHLYELERFHSKALITTIYSHSNPLEAILSVMVKEEPLKSSKKSDAIHIVDKVSAIAKKLNVYKRPYLVLVKRRKK